MRSSFIALVLSRELLYCFFHVPKKIDLKRTPRRRPRVPKKPTRNGRIVQLLVLLVASIIIVDGLVGDRGLLAMLRARHEYDQLAGSIARQRAENARLRDQARRLREDPSAIEEIARRELGLIKPGERVFIVKDVKTPKAPHSPD
jgi:cell division protein FtsB